MKKRIVLFALIVLIITCLSAVPVSAETYSGKCGDNLTWELDTSTGVLEIDGMGEMTNWSSYTSVPWHLKRNYIKSVNICDSVTSIGDGAFRGCSSLTSVDIPDSVTSIGDYAFYSCDSLTSIAVDKANTKYSSDEYGVLFNKDKTTLIQYPIGNTRTSYTIPDGVTSIGDEAFDYCDSLTSVAIGSGVTSIEDGTFYNCSSLTSVVIPNNVTRIGWGAFYNCSSLTSVVIPNSVTNIDSYAFYNCDSLTIYVYSGSYAETYAKNNSINYIVLDGDCGDNIKFNFDINTETLKITGTGDMYNWSWSNSVPWYSCLSNIKSVTIDDGVTSIGSSAFENCTSLTSIVVPDSVTSISSSAFNYCTALTIYGYTGSCAEIYANYNNIPFISLSHTIKFIDKDGLTISSKIYKKGDTVELPTAPDIYGFEFLGWSDGVNDELITEDFIATTDITLTAVYKEIKYTVTFIDKIGDEISSLEYKLDSTVTLPTAPTLNGYTFLGWSDGVSDELITEDFTATADITLTATYKGNEYVVIFDTNGGSVSQSVKNVTFGSVYGELPVPVREGYEFIGWYTENGKSVTETTIVNTAETHILYAKWTKVYSVKFLNVSGELISSAEYKTDEKVIFPDLAEITGYTFAGWSYSTTGKIITGNVYVNSDIEFYARYNANEYMVVFIANGGSVSTTNKTVTYDSKYGELPVPVLEGYRFAGWYTSATGGEKISEDTIVKITEMQYLYAQWTEKSEIPGDVNADGKVDRKDLTRLSQYFARWDVEIDSTASDANGDGKVDRKDLTRLSQYFARWDVEIGK